MFQKNIDRASPYLLSVFRILVGLFFLQHGLQKLFGMFGAQKSVELLSLMGIAGIVEFVAGIAIAVGFFTRPAALVSAVQMLVAYFMAHAPSGWAPIANKGELALLFFAAFLVLIAKGAGKWSLEKAVLKKEIF